MTERGQNNLPDESDQVIGKIDDQSIGDAARPICPKCLSPCHPLQYYCHNCDCNEVINPLASYMPFVRIRFNIGMLCKMWRLIWYDKEARVIFKLACLFVIMLLALIFLMGTTIWVKLFA